MSTATLFSSRGRTNPSFSVIVCVNNSEHLSLATQKLLK